LEDHSQGRLGYDVHYSGGEFGGQVRKQFEELTNEPVVSSQNFLDQPKGKRKKKQLPVQEQGTLFNQEGQEQSPER
jgi:hypothetical protein